MSKNSLSDATLVTARLFQNSCEEKYRNTQTETVTMFDAFGSFLNDRFTIDDATIVSVFKAFDQDNDDLLNSIEFENFLKELFKNDSIEYCLTKQQSQDLTYLINIQQNGCIDLETFSVIWTYFVRSVLNPKSALILVDLQNDHAAKLDTDLKSNLFAKLNELCDKNFDMIIFALDFLPDTHISFIENLSIYKDEMVEPPGDDIDKVRLNDMVVFQVKSCDAPISVKMRYKECVQNSQGACIVNQIKVAKCENCFKIYKSTQNTSCSFSAFTDSNTLRDTGLLKLLREKEVTDVYVAGVWSSYCVKETAIDALRHGFRTSVIWDCCCDSETRRFQVHNTFTTLSSLGIAVVLANQVANMLSCKNRRPELGYLSAVNFAMAFKKLATTTLSH